MSDTRDSFVEHFGEDQAQAIEAAAEGHGEPTHNRPPKGKGSDPFRWAIVVCIGYECMSDERFRGEHGITAPWDDVKQWIKDHGDLASHDGDIDHLALFCGVYNEYVEEAEAL